MKLLIVLIIPFLLLLTLCTMSENYSQVSTTEVKEKNEQQVIKLEDLITLELTIDESSDLREDYLLVRPYDVSINYNDDIVLVDEDKIKIYDKSGKGKKTIGRKGQGPGDFMGAPYVVITPNGFVTADEGGGALNNRYYTVFKPDYNILNKWRYYPSPKLEEYLTNMNMDFKITTLVKIVAINQESFVYQINFFEKDTNNQNTLIAFEDNKDFKPVFCGRNPFYIVYKKFALQTTRLNNFGFHILPDNKILYFNTAEDSIIDSNLGYYSFHIFSLETNSDIVYKNKFIPQELSEETIDKFVNTVIKDPSASDFKKFVRKTLLEDGYRPSISRIIIDRNFIFIFLSNIDNNRIVQVFDSNINKIIYEFKWPIEFERPYSIGNGRFCLVSYDDEGLPILRKYKVNPIVYGLPEDPDWKKKKRP